VGGIWVLDCDRAILVFTSTPGRVVSGVCNVPNSLLPPILEHVAGYVLR